MTLTSRLSCCRRNVGVISEEEGCEEEVYEADYAGCTEDEWKEVSGLVFESTAQYSYVCYGPSFWACQCNLYSLVAHETDPPWYLCAIRTSKKTLLIFSF
jgi:hypothetical protein